MNELTTLAQEELSKALRAAQERSHGNALCNLRPDEWLEIAEHVLHGKPDCHLRYDWGGKFRLSTIHRVKADLAESAGIDRVKDMMAQELAASISLGADVLNETFEKFSEQLKDADFKVGGSDIGQIGKAQQAQVNMYLRLKGDAPPAPKERAPTSEELDALKEKLLAELKMKRAEDAIDVGE